MKPKIQSSNKNCVTLSEIFMFPSARFKFTELQISIERRKKEKFSRGCLNKNQEEEKKTWKSRPKKKNNFFFCSWNLPKKKDVKRHKNFVRLKIHVNEESKQKQSKHIPSTEHHPKGERSQLPDL